MRLEVKNLEKSFKSEKVLQDINLDFTDGHIYGIIGAMAPENQCCLKLYAVLCTPMGVR